MSDVTSVYWRQYHDKTFDVGIRRLICFMGNKILKVEKKKPVAGLRNYKIFFIDVNAVLMKLRAGG